MAGPAAEHPRIFGQLCRVQVAPAVMRILYKDFLRASSMCAFAGRRDLAGHLRCKVIVFMGHGALCLVPVRNAGCAFNVRADKDLLHDFLL